MPRALRSSPLLILVALALLTLVIFGTVPGSSRLSQAVQNAAHAPAFFALSLIVLTLLRNCGASSSISSLRMRVFAICLVLGIGIEGVQALLGRDASAMDVLADALGTVAGLACFTARGGRALIVCFVSLVAAWAPLAWCCAAYLNRYWHFPVLAEFHSSLDLYFLRSETSSLELRSDGRLQVQFKSGDWPGVTIEEPQPDWTGYRSLLVELRNPGERSLPLIVRVHDAAHERLRRQRLEDRYNGRFELAPQTTRRLEIPLTTIETAPEDRRMDMRHIAGIVIFTRAEFIGACVDIDRIWLE